MNSSGMKRGLAASAISALAVAGLPLFASSASATPLDSQVGPNAVVLYTPDDLGAASIKNDGVNTTVHLLANAGTSVAQVRFEYGTNPAGPFTTIATVSRSNGAFSTEWTPPVGVYNLPVHVRAVAVDNLGIDGNVDDNTATVTSNQDSIDISNAPGSAIGVFHQPYTTVAAPRAAAANKDLGSASATTSDVANDPAVQFSAPYGGTAQNEDVASTPATGASSRSVSGKVDFTGYDWGTATDADQAIVEANVGGVSGGSDAEAVTVYQQTITTVTAAAASPTVQGAGTTSATVTVLDQNGKPVAGAEVFQDDNGDNAGDAAPKYTNSEGKATFTGLGGSTNGTTHSFFVNTTDSVNYDAGSDFKRSVTVTSYTPSASTITASSHDGNAFDFDENSAGDITLTVKDQNGNPKAGETIVGKWTMTAFSNGAVTTATPTITDNGDGTYNVSFPGTVEGSYKLDAWIEKDGTPGQSAGDLSAAPLTVKAGEANIVWNDGDKAQAPAGTTTTVNGVIELDDHTGLPNRNVLFTWTKNVTGDAVLAAQAAQPAGTTRDSNTAAHATADGSGKFGVAIADPAANPQTAELGGTIKADSTTTPAYGTNGDASKTMTVDFLADTAVSSATSTTAATPLDALNGATPGRPVRVNIHVTNAAGTALTDLPVKVSTDHGFFTTDTKADGTQVTSLANLKADPAAADGANYGEWENRGASLDKKTNDTGDAWAVVAIERDAGFDDNGLVTATVKFEVGGKTFTVPVTFDSSNPMNPGTVSIVLDDKQTVQSSTLPNAPTTEMLSWNVQATDQFGNLTDEPVSLTDGSSAADLYTQDGPDSGSAPDSLANGDVVTSNFDGDAPALITGSDVTADQTVTGTWAADTQTWKDADTTTAGFQGDTEAVDNTATGTKNVTGTSSTIHWYTIDFAASTYTLSHNTADSVPVGTTVIETYKAVDQHGEPIAGLTVGFYRTGPDQQQDGDGNGFPATGQDGTAQYVFQGTQAGTATTTAIARDGSTIIQSSQKTDSVNFVAADPIVIHPTIKGAHVPATDTIAGYDKLTVSVPENEAIGAEVRLYRVKNGVAKRVKTKLLPSNGKAIFKRADLNGDKKTFYYAVVMPTSDSKKGTTSTIGVK